MFLSLTVYHASSQFSFSIYCITYYFSPRQQKATDEADMHTDAHQSVAAMNLQLYNEGHAMEMCERERKFFCFYPPPLLQPDKQAVS